jgi:methionine-rich copper-binding protein CopC
MKNLTSAIGAALLFASAFAQAHSHLQSSKPAEGSVVNAAPTAIELNFSEAVTLTALSIQKGDEKSQSLAPPSDKPTQKISIAVPPLSPGKYVVNYRAVSDDNHVMPGALHFTVGAQPAKDAAMDHSKVPGMDHSKMKDPAAPEHQ